MVDEPFCLPPTTKEGTPSVDAVRGFVFSSGRSWMQAHGLFERYLSPWVALRSMHKVWLRSNRGGAVAVYKLGEVTELTELGGPDGMVLRAAW